MRNMLSQFEKSRRVPLHVPLKHGCDVTTAMLSLSLISLKYVFTVNRLQGSRHCLASTLSSDAASPSFHVVCPETRQNMWFHWVSTDIKNAPLPYQGKYKRQLFPLCPWKALRENTNLSAEYTVENTHGNVSISRSTSLAVSRELTIFLTRACFLNLTLHCDCYFTFGKYRGGKVQSVKGEKSPECKGGKKQEPNVELTRGMGLRQFAILFFRDFNKKHLSVKLTFVLPNCAP